MKHDEHNNPRDRFFRFIRRNLLFVFVVAQILVIAPFTYIHLTLGDLITSEQSTGEVINVSGRQRMLSQRIALLSNRLIQEAVEGNETEDARDLLFDTIDIMDESHHALAFGSGEFEFTAKNIVAAERIYFSKPHNLSLEVQKYLDAARRIAVLPAHELSYDLPLIKYINETGMGPLLEGLDAATKAFEVGAKGAISSIAEREQWLWILTIIIILAELALIYFPVHKVVQNQITRLRSNERLFRALYDSSPIMLHSVDQNGTITRVSSYWLEHLGYERQDVLGRHITDFLTDESARRATNKYLPMFMREGHVLNVEYQILKKDGTVLDVLLSAEAEMDEDGQLVASFAAMVDVTEQRILQAELQKNSDALEQFHKVASRPGLTMPERIRNVLRFGNTFFDTSLGVVSRIDGNDYEIEFLVGADAPTTEGTVMQANDSYCETVLSDNDPKAFDDMRLTEFVSLPCYGASGFNTYIGVRLNVNGERYGTLNFSARNARPELFDNIDLAFMRILGQWVSTMIEQELAAKEIRRARKEAESANETKSAFLANMSHEIRTPLNAIIGLTDLVRKTELTEMQTGHLARVSMAGNNLLALINDILDFSKIEAGKMQIELVDFRLNDVLQNLASVISPRADEKGLEVIIEVDSRLSNSFHGDPLRIGQVLINLAGNAVKFTDVGEVIIRVQQIDYNGTHANLMIKVADTGIGMSDEQCEKLFAPFVQADTSTSRSYGGTGLGLSISKQLVEAMGGEVWVESKEGAGSTFFFTVPLVPVDMEAPTSYPKNIDAKSIRILVVDDNEAARTILGKSLRRMGFPVEVADSGHEALEKIQSSQELNQPFGLVLIDWQMPGMNGVETAEKIVSLDGERKLPKIIMISAHSLDEISDDMARLEISGFVNKPINTSLLFDQLMFVLQDGGQDNFNQIAADVRQTKGLQALQPGARLLLAEDNELNQMVARGILENAGFVLEIAGNGQQAIDKLLQQGPNYYRAVLMDIQMPEMDGLTATRIIREDKRFSDLPVLAMTAHALAEERERCHKAGMDDHISKPVDPRELISKLNAWIGSPKKTKTDLLLDNSPMGDNVTGNTAIAFDINAVSSRLMLPVEKLKPMIKQYVDTYANADKEILILTEAGRWDDAIAYAHSVKGVSGTLGAMEIENAAAGLEDALRQKETDLGELNATFSAAVRRMIPIMRDSIG